MAGCHIINHIESYDEEKEVGFDMYSYDPNQANMISTNGVVSCTGKHVQSKVNMFMVPKLRPSLTMAHLLWDNLLPKDLQQGKRGLDDIVTENKFKYARTLFMSVKATNDKKTQVCCRHFTWSLLIEIKFVQVGT